MPSERDAANGGQRPTRAWPWLSLCLGAGALASGETLLVPFTQDDRVQRAMALGGFPAPRGVFDLYDFVRVGERARFVDLGILPWWTDERFKLRFFRPLASALLYAEHRWIGSAFAMHALSFVWWAAMVLTASGLFRRLVPARAAAIATLIFALAPCHEFALALVAQREVLVATTFGVLGLSVLARLNAGSATRAALAAGALFTASLAAGEYGLAIGGYVLAFALAGPASERARRIAPFAVPAMAYLGLRAVLGYGATGMGFYRDPIHEPAVFLARAPRSFVSLVADAWSTFDAAAFPLWALLLFVGGVAIIVVRAAPAGPLRWLLGGSLLALLPLVASAPGQRLVGPAMIGVAPALGAWIDRALATPRSFSRVVVAAAAAGLHLIHAPVASFREARAHLDHARSLGSRTDELHALRAGRDHVGVVGLAAWDTAFFTDVQADSVPSERMPWRVLVTAHHALLLRTGDRTLDVVVPKGQGFFPVGADDIFRPEGAAFHSGDEVDVPGMHVLVVSDGTSAAPRMRFTFDRDLDDPALVWCTEHRTGIEVIAPPRQGFGVQLSP